MGSLEKNASLKRTPLLRCVGFCRSFFHRPRSRFARFLLFQKIDYLQWSLTAAAFFCVVILFQAFLPGSVPNKSISSGIVNSDHGAFSGDFLNLDFGEGIRFVPAKLLERVERDSKEANSTLMGLGRPMKRAGTRKPRLALIFGGFSPDSMQLQMISIAAALKEIGYEIEDRHCYSRVLELLVNLWAYHSARRMVYVNPETGAMQEQDHLKSRSGKMWIKWFSFATLKSMDEDLAEEWDLEHPDRRWLWPSTGEVFWHGIYERERNIRHQLRERRRQQSRDKLRRVRSRVRQKSLGNYIKPPPENNSALNVTGT